MKSENECQEVKGIQVGDFVFTSVIGVISGMSDLHYPMNIKPGNMNNKEFEKLAKEDIPLQREFLNNEFIRMVRLSVTRISQKEFDHLYPTNLPSIIRVFTGSR